MKIGAVNKFVFVIDIRVKFGLMTDCFSCIVGEALTSATDLQVSFSTEPEVIRFHLVLQ